MKGLVKHFFGKTQRKKSTNEQIKLQSHLTDFLVTVMYLSYLIYLLQILTSEDLNSELFL